jgi:hypothetical protein
MIEVMVIFSLAAAGCVVRMSAAPALQLFARRMPNGTIAGGPSHGQSPEATPTADPVVTFGVTLGCYGAIALALVAKLPGDFASERTYLAFALLCVGGLICEISRARAGNFEAESEDEDVERDELSANSVGLSVALMLTLNLAVAVLCSGQGLVPIIPQPKSVSNDGGAQLEQIVVVARRTTDDGPSLDDRRITDDGGASFL